MIPHYYEVHQPKHPDTKEKSSDDSMSLIKKGKKSPPSRGKRVNLSAIVFSSVR